MTTEQIFEHLFETAARSHDPRGIVSACLVKDGEIIASAASSDDGVRHAEDILLENARANNIIISEEYVLYSTLEPCTKRSNPALRDCTSMVIESGIKKVIYGASDPDHSEIGRQRFLEAGVNLTQTTDPLIIKRCAEIFNDSVNEELAGVNVKRKPTE
jgi:diaminohydroxyphosphoribosylaminopyrimidine deaminase/5-amino-6-(5-phosphoribosylamino)uracil reductase